MRDESGGFVKPNMVDHPPHYQSGGMEAIDVIEAFDLGFCLGNAVKYILRAGKKGSKKEESPLVSPERDLEGRDEPVRYLYELRRSWLHLLQPRPRKGDEVTPKQKVGCALGLISLFVCSPIWYYLMYCVLDAVHATPVMWLLYWIYVPATLFIAVVNRIIESAFEE